MIRGFRGHTPHHEMLTSHPWEVLYGHRQAETFYAMAVCARHPREETMHLRWFY